MSQSLRIKIMHNIDLHLIKQNKQIDDKIDTMFKHLDRHTYDNNLRKQIELPFDILMRPKDSSMCYPTAALVKADLTDSDRCEV